LTFLYTNVYFKAKIDINQQKTIVFKGNYEGIFVL